MKVLEGIEIKDDSGRVIASALIHTGSIPISYHGTFGFSIKTYKSELRDYTTEKYKDILAEENIRFSVDT